MVLDHHVGKSFQESLAHPVTDEESNFIYQAVLKIELFVIDMDQEIFLFVPFDRVISLWGTCPREIT